GEGHGRAADLEEGAARHALGRLGRAVGELARQGVHELGRLVALLEAPPPLLAGAILDHRVRQPFTHRWHPEQWVGGVNLRPFLAIGSAPSLDMSGSHSLDQSSPAYIFVMSAGSRTYGAGLRWQSRHQLMESGCTWRTRSI